MTHELPPGTQPSGNPSASNSESGKGRLPPRLIIAAGIERNSPEEISRGLHLAAKSSAYKSILPRTFAKVVSKGSVSLTEYLLSHENASADSLDPSYVSMAPSPELLSVLISHGWDINSRPPNGGDGKGKRLLDYICNDEALVRWCLDHGASVEDDPEASWYMCPPLLENAAAMGTLGTFKLLHDRGAVLGKMTLHRAARSAATSEDLEPRMEVVKYLVDELGLDVNGMDREVGVPDSWGTPLCYVAKTGTNGGKEVSRFLLERGADPTIKNNWGDFDALILAEENGNQGVLKVLEDWKSKNKLTPE